MAVINDYVDANVISSVGKLTSAAFVSGVPEICAVQAFTVAATDSASSIYRIFKGIPADAIILELYVMNDAVAGVSAGTIGLFNVKDFDGVGAAVAASALASSFDFSSAHAIASGWVNCKTAVSIANHEKALWELASQTQAPGAAGPKASAYDIGVTMVGMTTNTANLVFKLHYVRGV